jgi:hypothetical protein
MSKLRKDINRKAKVQSKGNPIQKATIKSPHQATNRDNVQDQKDQHKSKKEVKKSGPKHAEQLGHMTRCCLCMGWFHAPDEEIFGGTVWTCQTCRTIPSTILDIQKQLSAAMQTNMDLVSNLTGRIAEIDMLHKENNELRQTLNTRDTSSKGNNKHLLIGDETISGFSSLEKSQLEIIHKTMATTKDIQQAITNKSKTSKYEKVTVVVGSKDCEEDLPIQDLTRNITQLVHQAKAITSTGDVRVSSILPRTDDTSVQERVEQFNCAVEDICKTNHIQYIDNDLTFRLGNGDINDGFLECDGNNLNKAGQSKLVKNLGLQGAVQITCTESWEQTQSTKHRRKQVVQPKSRAPCYNCGEPNHTSNICKFRKRITCHKCGKQGHKSTKCGQH